MTNVTPANHEIDRQSEMNKLPDYVCMYNGRQWCVTATDEWDSVKNHLKVVRIS